MVSTFPHLHTKADTYGSSKQIHSMFNSHANVDLDVLNQDIVGFFISIPQERFTQALQHTVHKWLPQNSRHKGYDTVMTVQTKCNSQRMRSMRGNRICQKEASAHV